MDRPAQSTRAHRSSQPEWPEDEPDGSAARAVTFGDRRGLKLEYGILDQADEIAGRAAERGELDAFPDILDGFDDDRASGDHVLSGCRDAAHAPVGTRTGRRVGVRVQAQLVAAGIR